MPSEKLEKQHVDFLTALRRDLKILEYGSEEDYGDYLSWRGRYIWHRNYRVKGQHLFIVKDKTFCTFFVSFTSSGSRNLVQNVTSSTIV